MEPTKHKKRITADLSPFIYGKVPPQAKELEVAVLGGIMLDKDAFDTVAEILNAESFYVPTHQTIFRAFQRLNARSVQIEVIAVVTELKKMEELDIVGGPYAITQLTNAVGSTANIEEYCFIIKQKFMQRELIRVSGETIAEAYEDSADAFDILDKHETKISAITNNTASVIKMPETLAKEAMERADFLINNRGRISGVPTGFPFLTIKTNGWQPTDLIILAARPSVGKTAFALNLAKNAASDPHKPTPVAFFSLEMSSGQLVDRILSAESGINLENIKNGKFFTGEYERFMQASIRFSKMKIYIDDSASLNIYELRSKARKLVNKHKVGLIIVDYLQLMSGVEDKKVNNREGEISNISRNLKKLAKELNVPIIALSQMSRAIETRKGEPQLSDLRESGAIEQDADLVMFLWRPDYQLQDNEIDPSIKGDGMGKVAKHRNGDLLKMSFKTELNIQMWYEEQQYENIQRLREYGPSMVNVSKFTDAENDKPFG